MPGVSFSYNAVGFFGWSYYVRLFCSSSDCDQSFFPAICNRGELSSGGFRWWMFLWRSRFAPIKIYKMSKRFDFTSQIMGRWSIFLSILEFLRAPVSRYLTHLVRHPVETNALRGSDTGWDFAAAVTSGGLSVWCSYGESAILYWICAWCNVRIQGGCVLRFVLLCGAVLCVWRIWFLIRLRPTRWPSNVKTSSVSI